MHALEHERRSPRDAHPPKSSTIDEKKVPFN